MVDAVSQVSAALCGVLSREEWNIVHAPDNRSALRLVEARPFDLIITGTESTGKEDIDLLRSVEENPPGPTTCSPHHPHGRKYAGRRSRSDSRTGVQLFLDAILNRLIRRDGAFCLDRTSLG